jgi:hypothetical protein
MRVTKDTRVLQRLIRETPDKADDLLRAAAEEIKNDIVLSFTVSPSSPGEPPGVDSNTLRGSMRSKPEGKLRYLVLDGVEYGIYLELGTERMAARPFVAPMFEEWRTRKFATFAKAFGVLK